MTDEFDKDDPYARHADDEWKMIDLNNNNWRHKEPSHLVQAHEQGDGVAAEPFDAHAERLVGYALNLSQLRWVYFDTHAALDIAQARPPDGHVHRALPDPGGPGQPAVGYTQSPAAS
jgi:hypothetical protein